MKKYSLIFFFLLFGFSISFAQKTTLKGTLNYPSKKGGVSISIIKLNSSADGTIIIDSVMVKANGKFAFNLDIKTPVIYYLQIPGNPNPYYVQMVFYPKQNVEIDLVVNEAKNMIEYKGVKGSKDMELSMQMISFSETTSQLLEILKQRYAEAVSEEEKIGIEGEYNKVIQDYQGKVKNLITTNKSLLINAVLISALNIEENSDLYKEIASLLDSKYPNVQEVKQLKQQVKQLLNGAREGKPAPEIELADVHANVRKLSSLKGKYVLIDFWASWCGPCRKENPNVVALYNKYKDKGFDIFSVSLDKDKQAWIRAINQDNLIWDNHVSDLKQWSSEVLPLYGFNSIPFTVLIDKNGIVLAKGLRGQELEARLAEIFGE